MPTTVVKEGLLGVCKKGGRLESRYFILYQDRLEYFLSQEDARSGSDPRGRLGLKSIQECDELDDSSGFKLVLGEGKGLEVKVYNGQEELDSWLDALASVWADEEQEENKQAPAQSQAPHAIDKNGAQEATQQEPASLNGRRTDHQVAPSSTERQSGRVDDAEQQKRGDDEVNLPQIRSVSWKMPQEGEVATIVRQGDVGVLKKGVAEPRYLILFTDRFELFATGEDYQRGENPRSRVTHEGVENLEFSSGGFSIHHPKRVFEIQVDSKSDNVQKWFKAWEQVFDFEVAKENSSKAARQDVRPDESTTKKANKKSDGGTSTAASTASSPQSTAVVSGPPSTAEKPRQPEELVLCQGILSQLKKGLPERRHCLLYYDRLEIYSSLADFNDYKNPRGRIAISDIQEIDVLDMGFSIKLPDRSVKLHAIHKTDFAKWQTAFGKACSRRVEEETAANEDTDQAEVKEQTPSIHEGEVTIQYHGAVVSSSRYMVLVSDSIQIYRDKKARLKNAQPEAIIAKESVKNLDVLDTGFEIQAADKSCTVWADKSELEGWLLSLSCLLEDESKEEPLQSASQLQQVPDSSRRGEYPPRLVWQSMLEVQEGGYGVWKYFALYEDVLVSYHAANDMATGKDPEGRIPLNQVQDVKVGSMGFVLQFPTFNLAFRVSNEPGALDAWVAALHRVLVFSSPTREAAHPQQLLHQGTLELLEDKQAKLRHFYLYADRLEHFSNTMDALNGRRCENKILLADVLGFTVLERGFVLRLARREIELRVVSREDLEVWVAALRGALDDQSRRQQLALTLHQDSPAELHSMHPGTPGFGADVNNSWKDWSSSSTPRHGYKMAKVLQLLFPAAPWPLSDRFEAELRSNLQTMCAPRGIQHTLSGVSFKDGCVTAEILGNIGALEDLLRTVSLPNDNFSVLGYKVGEVIIGTTKVLANHDRDQKGQAIYQGPLGIQHGGCLSQKYFMLFEDRLDYFDTKNDALSGVRPRGRIALGEVSSYEAYGSGFILKLLGRSVGLHVSPDGRDQWSHCLLEALRNSKVVETSKPGKTRPQGAWAAGRVGGPKAKPRPRSTTPRRRPQPNNEISVSSNQSLNGSGGIMRSRNPLSPAMSSTSRADSAHSGWVSTRGDEYKDVRKNDGSYWQSRDISGKICGSPPERDARVLWTRRGSDPTLTDKVTGDRCASGALASRLAAPRLNDTAQKVNQSLTPRSCPTLGHSRSSPEITGKVNEAGRITKNTESSLNHRCVSKITDTARDGSGWLHRGPEKAQTSDKVAGLDCATLGRSAQRSFPFTS